MFAGDRKGVIAGGRSDHPMVFGFQK